MSILRLVLAVIVGFVLACVITMTIETVNAKFLYPDFAERAAEQDAAIVKAFEASGQTGAEAERELAMRRREVVREALASAPVVALLVVLGGWVLGSVAGGFVAAWIGRRPPMVIAVALGGLLTLSGVANNLMIPPPTWFWITSLPLFIPATYVGALLASQRARARPAAAAA